MSIVAEIIKAARFGSGLDEPALDEGGITGQDRAWERVWERELAGYRDFHEKGSR